MTASSPRQIIQEWRKANPDTARALLYTVAGPEGTLKNGNPAFNIYFGGKTFSLPAKNHPNIVATSGGYSSAAAGVGQFVPKTWEQVSKELGLTDFNKESQIDALYHLARKRLLPVGGLAALKDGLTPEIVDRLAPEWASLPTLSGKSYYGQPVKKFEEVQDFWQQGLNAKEDNEETNAPTASSGTSNPQPTTTGSIPTILVQNINTGPAKKTEDEDEDEGGLLGSNFLSAYIEKMLQNTMTPIGQNPFKTDWEDDLTV